MHTLAPEANAGGAMECTWCPVIWLVTICGHYFARKFLVESWYSTKNSIR